MGTRSATAARARAKKGKAPVAADRGQGVRTVRRNDAPVIRAEPLPRLPKSAQQQEQQPAAVQHNSAAAATAAANTNANANRAGTSAPDKTGAKAKAKAAAAPAPANASANRAANRAGTSVPDGTAAPEALRKTRPNPKTQSRSKRAWRTALGLGLGAMVLSGPGKTDSARGSTALQRLPDRPAMFASSVRGTYPDPAWEKRKTMQYLTGKRESYSYPRDPALTALVQWRGAAAATSTATNAPRPRVHRIPEAVLPASPPKKSSKSTKSSSKKWKWGAFGAAGKIAAGTVSAIAGLSAALSLAGGGGKRKRSLALTPERRAASPPPRKRRVVALQNTEHRNSSLRDLNYVYDRLRSSRT